MKRGIDFEIPNEHGRFLWEVLAPFEMTEFVWTIGHEESYIVEDNALERPLFPEEKSGMDGLLLRKLLENNMYYLIFANLQAYPRGEHYERVDTYEEFVNSHCQLVLLVVDTINVTIYCKDKEKLENLYQQADIQGFHHLRYITDKNDSRTSLSVW
ncbi:DUF2691 family protein [Bacillus sp. FJAT-42376]|uniref:DUF2691 family protein n=1 Tax=Bacillus sp. FJAT-42376 TaxID=2014076 RepID=UPI000F50B7E8|nr:DUF2691 family protein [Bacillus sp. FJAT-42376]AZB41779.1 DUF2691 family protein [Bacillus sp. FJAT-42376]